MAKTKLKKANTKKRSERSLAYEAEQKKLAEQKRESENKRRKRMSAVGNTMLCYYSLTIAVLSWLFDYMGILAAVAIIIGIFGAIRVKRDDNRREWLVCRIGIVLALIRLFTEYVPVVMTLLKG